MTLDWTAFALMMVGLVGQAAWNVLWGFSVTLGACVALYLFGWRPR